MPVVNFFEPREGDLGASFAGRMPVNVRTLNGVDLKGVKVNRLDGKNWGTPYEV